MDLIASHHPLSYRLHLLIHSLIRRHPVLYPVALLLKTELLHDVHIIWIVVQTCERSQFIKTFNEHTLTA